MNEYAQAFGQLYKKTPKAIFAAIVWSYASAGGDCPENAVSNFLVEWQILHDNAIVLQKPMRRIK